MNKRSKNIQLSLCSDMKSPTDLANASSSSKLAIFENLKIKQYIFHQLNSIIYHDTNEENLFPYNTMSSLDVWYL